MHGTEQLVSELLARARVLAFAVDAAGRFTHAWGVVAECVGASLFELWAERAWAVQAVQCALTGEPVVSRGPWVDAEIELRVEPLRDAAGSIAGATGVAVQLSGPEELRRALWNSSSALDATDEGVLIVDPRGRITAFNRRFAELWRLPPEVLATRNDERAIAYVLDQLEDPDGFERRVRELYGSTEPLRPEPIYLADGRIYERTSRPQLYGGEIIGRVHCFRDVTAQRRAEAERDRLLARETEVRRAAERAERRSAFLADASRLLATLDCDSALVTVARYVARTIADWCLVDLVEEDRIRRLAVEHASTQDRRLRELFDHGSDVPRGVRDVVRSKRPQLYERCDQEPGLFDRGVSCYIAAPLVFRGQTLGVLTLVCCRQRGYDEQDVALAGELASRAALAMQNARLYQRVEGAVEQRERLLSVASHELRGPLGSLGLALDALQRLFGGSEQPKALGIIERQMQRLTQLVDDLLDVARIRAGRFNVEAEDVDLGEAVRAAISRSEPDLVRSRSELRLDIEPGLVGRWDRLRLDQVIANLLSNAVKYGAGRPIEIRASCREGTAELVVRDHGIGIAAERLPQIFDPFVRAVSERRYAGLGLGLYIVKSIVNALGGSIEVESRLGEGSTFRVLLPRCSTSLS
jgi:signal transduction histidine kinase/PAS domain-containing protein